jgi:uncharacterized protein (DUF885 family)
MEQAAPSARTDLERIIDDDWENRLSESPFLASRVGDHRFDDRLPQVRESDFQRRLELENDVLNRLLAIDESSLNAADRLNLLILKRQKEDAVTDLEFRDYLIPITSRSGFHIFFPDLPRRLRLRTVEDFENFITRLERFLGWARQHAELMRVGIAEGMVLPTVVLDGYEDAIVPHIVDDPRSSRLFDPFKSFPDDVPDSEHERLANAASAAIRDSVVPGFREFLAFMRDEYYPATRDTIACSSLPNGKALYEHFVRAYSTLDVTPEDVHETGLREVRRIETEMIELVRETGFEGGMQEFETFLRENDRFYFDDAGALLKKVATILERMSDKLPSVFSSLPRTPYEIEEVPDYIAPKTTSAYYSPPVGDGTGPGIFYVNTHGLRDRPIYEFEALSFHEAVPGHHLQIALQHELDTLPRFRRHSGFTAFVEGWALYAERLGLELGFYEDPYSNFGRLTFEMWRACRLVVDTGMHYLGWSRDRAIQFMTDHTTLAELNIRNEIDRYIAWPGQALAYKMGELKMRELRGRAEDALGAAFDVREFHAVVLEQGSVPLDILEQQVEDYIASGLGE